MATRVNRTARVGLVVIGAYSLLTLAAFWGGESYLAAWLPLLRVESAWLLPHGFIVDSIELVTSNGERLIALHIRSSTQLTFAHGNLPAGLKIHCTTLQAYALYHPVIAYAVLAAWPAVSVPRRLALLALGIPCVLITTSLDIPFVLTGLARELVLEHLEPERLGSDPGAVYYAFLHSGGRLGLAITGTLLAALAATRAGLRTAASGGPERARGQPADRAA